MSWAWKKFYNLGAWLSCMRTTKVQTRLSYLSYLSYCVGARADLRLRCLHARKSGFLATRSYSKAGKHGVWGSSVSQHLSPLKAVSDQGIRWLLWFNSKCCKDEIILDTHKSGIGIIKMLRLGHIFLLMCFFVFYCVNYYTLVLTVYMCGVCVCGEGGLDHPHALNINSLVGMRLNTHKSQCMRFPTMWYVRPAKPQISLRIRPVWSEPLLVAWVFYDC